MDFRFDVNIKISQVWNVKLFFFVWKMKISFKWTLCCLGNFANYYFILFQNCQQLEISFRKKKTLLFFLQLRHLFFSVYAIELIPLEKETHPPTVVLFWFNYGNKVTKSKIGEIVTSFPQYTTGNMFLSGLNFCYKIITNFFFFSIMTAIWMS